MNHQSLTLEGFTRRRVNRAVRGTQLEGQFMETQTPKHIFAFCFLIDYKCRR